MAAEDASVLIVEDEAVIALDLQAELEDAGWTVMGPAASVSQALSSIRDRRPTIALLDIELRGETTFALAECLRKKGLPVVFLTGREGRERPASLRDCHLIQKPADLSRIGALLRNLTAKDVAAPH
ncbi:response regulator [Tranquillimonas alkanivorans]|uniref:Response regulator receiver domain-containing protein n=1 Tax=Tranquillimonas alkanivorans TaxID=441119 RepID=A0A1I5M4V0_9RHOB|nr:response regulator [Tranquillimonas alkanivorans]SFP04559.1 Response regulator receiver domain-containing protein [Tranquillimonas alkanivorans]